MPRLRAALKQLNPDQPPEAIAAASEALSCHRSSMALVGANQELYQRLKDGVLVSVGRGHGRAGVFWQSQGSDNSVFSDDVSIDDFQEAVEDSATVLSSIQPDIRAGAGQPQSQ